MRRISTSGFTIAELLVVMAVSSILIGLVMTTIDGFYTSNLLSLGQTVQTGDTNTALRTIEQGVSTSAGFLTANTVTDPSLTSGWSYTGSSATSRTLIVSSYATTLAASGDTTGIRTLLYSTSSACATPITNNLVYFVSGGNLYRRTITNTTASCSGTMAQRQSCTAGSTVSGCQGTDALLLTGVSSFKIDYYTNTLDSSPYANQYGSGAQSTIQASSTKAIVATLTSTQRINGKDSLVTNSLRIVRQN